MTVLSPATRGRLLSTHLLNCTVIVERPRRRNWRHAAWEFCGALACIVVIPAGVVLFFVAIGAAG